MINRFWHWLPGIMVQAWLPGMAAEQGSLDTTSQGHIEIVMVLGSSARLSGLNDINVSFFGGISTTNYRIRFCVGLFNDSQNYSVRAEGSGTAEQQRSFALLAGSRRSLPYQVFFSDSVNASEPIELYPGQRLQNLSIGQSQQSAINAYLNLFGCYVLNASLLIRFASEDITAAIPGNYSGSLTLTIIPE